MNAWVTVDSVTGEYACLLSPEEDRELDGSEIPSEQWFHEQVRAGAFFQVLRGQAAGYIAWARACGFTDEAIAEHLNDTDVHRFCAGAWTAGKVETVAAYRPGALFLVLPKVRSK